MPFVATGLGRPQAPPPPLSADALLVLVLVLALVLEVALVTAVLVVVDVVVPPSPVSRGLEEHAPTESIDALNPPLIASAPLAPNRQALCADTITPPTKFE